MAEVLLRAHLDARGVLARVRSAGTLAWGGGATDHAAAVMRERGLALDGHRSRALAREDVQVADLVLGMTREHVWAAARLDEDATERAFLVGELARLGRSVGARRVDEGESVRAWTARVAAARRDGRVGRAGDDVADPLGEPIEVYRATAARLDRDLAVIAELLVPSAEA